MPCKIVAGGIKQREGVRVLVDSGRYDGKEISYWPLFYHNIIFGKKTS